MYKDLLNPEKALIFRICHKSNVEKVLNDGGCVCGNDADTSKYVEIGNQELIAKRKAHPVPCGPGGTLGDYVPFYFTPFSPMLYNIKTGYNGIACYNDTVKTEIEKLRDSKGHKVQIVTRRNWFL
jgi:ssDNA thymidine ADP-ribosyltransferase, DarT